MMYKKILTSFSTFLVASLLSVGAAYAADEYCVVTNKNGENVVKAGKSECDPMASANCKSGTNMAGDKNAGIMVPKGQCEKVKSGDFSGMSTMEAMSVKSKLDMDKMDKMDKTDKMNSTTTTTTTTQ